MTKYIKVAIVAVGLGAVVYNFSTINKNQDDCTCSQSEVCNCLIDTCTCSSCKN